MKFCLRIVLLLCLAVGTKTQGFDLADAFGDDDPTPAPPKIPKKPARDGDSEDFNILEAFDPEPTKAPPLPPAPVDPKKPAGNGDDFGFNLEDAFGPDPTPKPDKPAVNPPKGGGGGGSFSDDDLYKLAGGGDTRPDEDRIAGGGAGGAGEAQAGSGQIAGIASAIGVAILGAASGYFAYQKKRLCFKLQGGADPESGKGHSGTQSDPQEQETC